MRSRTPESYRAIRSFMSAGAGTVRPGIAASAAARSITVVSRMTMPTKVRASRWKVPSRNSIGAWAMATEPAAMHMATRAKVRRFMVAASSRRELTLRLPDLLAGDDRAYDAEVAIEEHEIRRHPRADGSAVVQPQLP